jgi:putative peptidoglycan lipid II flippase
VVVNVVVSLLTVQSLGLAGLALGIVVGAWFEAATLTWLLARRHAAVTVMPVVRAGAASLAGALGAGLAAAVVLALVPAPSGFGRAVGLALELCLAGAAGLGVYLVWSRLLRLSELPRTVDLLRSALRGG